MIPVSEVLEGKVAAVAALAAGDVSAWRPLLEHLYQHRPQAAGRTLIEAMIATEPSFDRWAEKARNAASECDSDLFRTTKSGTKAFWPWFMEGLRRTLPSDHLILLEARLAGVTGTIGFYDDDNSSEEARLTETAAVVDAAKKHWGHSPRVAEALLILHRRATEAGAHQRAFEAATEAEQLFNGATNARRARFAKRLAAASVLSLGDVQKGLSLLDPLLDESGPSFGGFGSFFPGGGPRTPEDEALDELATVATWASRQTPEWIRALGGVAERPVRPDQAPALWGQFERALTTMLESAEDPADELAIVVRQAEERGLVETVRRAEAVATRAGANK